MKRDNWYQSAGDLDDVRTLQHKNKYLVKSVYDYFKRVCMSPSFTLADWWLLYHHGSMDDWKNWMKTP